jgi:hypothetical protein
MNNNYFIIVIVIQIILLSYIVFFKNKKDHFLQLRNDHKIKYRKCCDDDKCYSKPPHLRKSKCKTITKEARNNLMNFYKQMYSNEEYNEIVKKIIQDSNKKIRYPESVDSRVVLQKLGEEREEKYRMKVKPSDA